MHCMANMSPEGNSAAGPYRRPPERRGRGTCSSRSGLDVHLFCSTGGAVEGPPLPQLLPAMQASAKLPGSANIFRCPTCSEHPVNITDFGRRNQFRPPLLNAAGCMQNSHMRRGGSSFMLLTKAGVRLSSRRRNLCSLSSNLSGRYLSAGLTGIVNLSQCCAHLLSPSSVSHHHALSKAVFRRVPHADAPAQRHLPQQPHHAIW